MPIPSYIFFGLAVLLVSFLGRRALCVWCALFGTLTATMSGGMWTPFMELVGVINAAILKKEPNAYYSLKEQLKKHKPDFMSLLKNPVSSMCVCVGVLCRSASTYVCYQHTVGMLCVRVYMYVRMCYVCVYVYSETSNKGHSERGQTSQQRTSRKYSCI